MTSTEETNKNIWQVCRLCMSKMHLTHLFTTDRNLYLKLTVCSLVQVIMLFSYYTFVNNKINQSL